MRAYYNCVYDLAKDNFLTYAKWNLGLTSKNYSNQELIRHWFAGWEKYNKDNKNFVESLYTQKLHSLEVQFLKTIQSYWSILTGQSTGKGAHKLSGTISEWFQYAENYIWELFPPTYWGYNQFLDGATIKYTPLYY
jgi:hypothetical protein